MTPDPTSGASPWPYAEASTATAAETTETFDTGHAHPARVYDKWLRGKDHFAADRKAAREVAQVAPWAVTGARANRSFLRRAVRYLAEQGIRQFLDIGSGLPSSGNVHEVAQAINAGCRVAYVDNDPIVLVHARALLANNNQQTIAVAGDARDPAGIFADPAVRGHLDLSQPLAVLFVALLHFIPADEPARIVTEVRDRLAPGSYLVISHTADLPDTVEDPDRAAATAAAAKLYGSLVAPFVLRTPAQVTALFDGFQLVPPGVVPAQLWRPDRRRPGSPIPVLAGIGHLPHAHKATDSGQGPDPAPERDLDRASTPGPGLGPESSTGRAGKAPPRPGSPVRARGAV